MPGKVALNNVARFTENITKTRVFERIDLCYGLRTRRVYPKNTRDVSPDYGDAQEARDINELQPVFK